MRTTKTSFGPKPTPMREKLLRNIRISADGCWEWQGFRQYKGYGVIRVDQKKITTAHREAWKTFRGPIPDGLFVCHKCDNPRCINPDHLFLGTNKDNILDALHKGRLFIARGEQNSGSKLTADQVIEMRRLWNDGELNQSEIARRYGVRQGTVHVIVRGKGWKHLLPTEAV